MKKKKKTHAYLSRKNFKISLKTYNIIIKRSRHCVDIYVVTRSIAKGLNNNILYVCYIMLYSYLAIKKKS